jgi:SpoIID/LytB domain protein
MRFRRVVAAAVGVGLAFGLVPGVPSAPVQAYPSDTVTLEGHGWGHGRGMGQYGALGYALAGWTWPQILQHYYSNTTDGTIGNPGMFVRLLWLDNQYTIAQAPGNGFMTAGNGAQIGPNGLNGMMAQLISGNQFRVYYGGGCAGPWTQVPGTFTGPIKFAAGSADPVLQACGSGIARSYRNDLIAHDSGSGQRTVNGVLMENYLRGVVPRESPASWGSLGGGAGMHALRAQAVAARSYAQSENRYPYAKTCDTDTCQVYGGSDGEAAMTNQAVADTAGHVRMLNGAVARTEFSSSTGGQTAGGTFPSVVDDGDATPQNPNHNWRTGIPVSTVEAKYPQLGTLISLGVTERTPADGSRRAKTVVMRGSSNNVTVSGDDFRIAFGLKSSWFSVVGSPSGGVNGYWLLGNDGGVFSFGGAAFYGSTGGMRLNQPVIGMAATKSGKGYWLVASDGGIFAYGDAASRFYGSTGGMRLNQPIVGMARTPSGNGYWLVASDGGIFSYGDAASRFFGSMGGKRLNQPIVGMVPTSTGNGYWLVASDGGIFAFGDAASHFYGSTGSMRLARPIIAMAALPNDSGYWLVGADGGIFAFNAPFYGSLPGRKVVLTATGMRPTVSGGGYLIAASNGDVNSFGDAPHFGNLLDVIPAYRGTVIGMEVSPGS